MSSSISSGKKTLSEDDIDFIMANTEFEREKIIAWYNEFISKVPDGKLNKEKFVDFFKQLTPGQGYAEQAFCECVFDAFDADSTGFIDFGEFLVAFGIRAKGSLRSKLEWLFDVYDTDNNNRITSWELSRMIRLLMNMKNITNEDPYDKANKIFAQFDKNNDGKVTKAEFIAVCTKDKYLRDLFSPF